MPRVFDVSWMDLVRRWIGASSRGLGA